MKHIFTGALVIALTSSTALAQTGRQLTTSPAAVDNGDGTSSQAIFDTFWDERCADVSVTVNSAVLPNETLVGATTISAEDTGAAIQAGLQRWTDNPSAFIEMEVDTVTPLSPLFVARGLLDFVNDTDFTFDLAASFGFPPGVLAVSVSTPLMADATFVPGDDIDGDGDSDVFDPDVEGIGVCTDIDADGDIEYPAGDYAAGTILDNTVLFNAAVVWETDATATGGADIDAVSTHEYGHSHGLTHSTINQISAEDGTSSTMFPSIATFDPASELSVRTPHSDDLAASAFIYPEGSSRDGIAALQSGDVAFSRAFTVLEGEVMDVDGNPILSASVQAVDRDGNVIAETFSGEVVTNVFDTATGVSLPESIDNGTYRLAVPSFEVYRLQVQSLDGAPVVPGSISPEAGIAADLGQTVFPEETLSLRESSAETRKVIDRPVFAVPYKRSSRRNLDFVLNDEGTIRNSPDATIFASIPIILGATTSFQFIEMFDRETVLAALDDGDVLVNGLFETNTTTPSLSPVFSSASLMTGTVDPDTGEVTLGETIVETRNGFLGQEDDLTPFVFKAPALLSRKVEHVLKDSPDAQLFLVASIDDVAAASDDTGTLLPVVLPSIAGPETGASFFTIDGGPVTSTVGLFTVPVNWSIELSTATPERRRRSFSRRFSRGRY